MRSSWRVGDFADARSVRAALEGADASSSRAPTIRAGSTGRRRRSTRRPRPGVRRIVKLSSIVAEPGSPVAFWDWHGQVEQHLRRRGPGRGPAGELLHVEPARRRRAGGARGPAVRAGGRGEDRDDRPARRRRGRGGRARRQPGHEGATYVLTGPAAITYAEVAAELSAATGREVEFIDVPDEAATQGMIEAGLPGVRRRAGRRDLRAARQGVAEQVTATVESLTGRPPRDFASFARDHARRSRPCQKRHGEP